jgi:hypothetical protein
VQRFEFVSCEPLTVNTQANRPTGRLLRISEQISVGGDGKVKFRTLAEAPMSDVLRGGKEVVAC